MKNRPERIVRTSRRVLSTMLVALLFFTLCPAAVFAQEGTDTQEPPPSSALNTLFLTAADNAQGKFANGEEPGPDLIDIAEQATADPADDSVKPTLISPDDFPTFELRTGNALSAAAGEQLVVSFTGAETGSSTYVSAILIPEGTTTPAWYGKLSQEAEGEAALTLPEGIALGAYTLVVFNERISTADEEADVPYDLASAPVEIALSVEAGEGILDELATDSESAALENTSPTGDEVEALADPDAPSYDYSDGTWLYVLSTSRVAGEAVRTATVVGYLGSKSQISDHLNTVFDDPAVLDYRITPEGSSYPFDITAINIQYAPNATVTEVLYQGNNKLTSFAVPAFAQLVTLNLSNCGLTSLDLSKNSALADLRCASNKLTSLDLSNNGGLTNLEIPSNELRSLTLHSEADLTGCNWESNQLLDVKNVSTLPTDPTVGGQSRTIQMYDGGDGNWYSVGAGLIDPSREAYFYGLDPSNPLPIEPDGSLKVPDDSFSDPLNSTFIVYQGSIGLVLGTATFEFGTSVQLEGDWIYEQTDTDSATLVGYVGAGTDLTLPETVEGNSLNVTAVNIQTSTPGVISVDAFDHQELTSFAAPAWTDLETLDVGHTNRIDSNLSYLDVSANTKLTALNCQNNWLTSLDLQANTQLEVLLCGGNDLATLDVSALADLQEFSCYNNLLSSLDVSKNTVLTTLMCAENNLGALDLSNNTLLTALNCSTNAITSLVLPSSYPSDIALNYEINRLLEVSGFTGTTGNLKAEYQNPLITMKREGNLWVSDSGLLQDSSVWADESGASTVISYNWARQRFEIAASAVSDTQLARTFSTSYSGKSPAPKMVVGTTSFLFIEGGGSIITPEGWLAELDTAAGTATIVGYMGQLFEHKDNPLLQTPAALGSAIVHEGSSYTITAIDIRTSMQGVNRFDYEATTSLTSFAAPAWEDLDTLVLDDNFSLTQVDVSENALLKVLSCNNGGLKQLVLPKAPSSLQIVLVEDNQLEQLDLSAYNLAGFNVSSNQLVSLLLPGDSASIPGGQLSYEANKLLSTTGGNGLPAGVALTKQTPSVMLYQEGDTWVSASGLVGADTVMLDDVGNGISYDAANKRFELDVSSNPSGSSFANSFTTTYESPSSTAAQGIISFEFIGMGNSLVQDDWVYQLDAPAVGEATVIGYLGNKTKATNNRSDTAGDPAYLDATVTPAGSITTYTITALKMTDPALTPHASLKEFIYSGDSLAYTRLTSVNLSACASLTHLNLSYGSVTSLDVSKNYQLTNLYCGYNNLSQLDVSANTQLSELLCGENALDQLDVRRNSDLASLDCSNNNLTALDVSQNHALDLLDCSSNQLSQLIVAGNVALHELRCWGNDLTTLDVTANAQLEVLQCGANYYLSELRLPEATGELKYLSCGSTSLGSLDVSAYQSLISLTCGDALLTSLSVPQTATLTDVFCSDNQLEQLDLLGCSRLDELYCADNQLVSLKVDGAAPLNVYEVRNNRLIDVSGFATAKDPGAIWAFGGQAVELAMYLDAATQCWVSVQQFSLDASTSITFDGNVAYYDDTLKRFAMPAAGVGADQETLLTSFSAFYNVSPSESYEFLTGDVTFIFDVVELTDGWQYQVTSAASGTAPGTATVVGYVGTADNPGNNPQTQENFANPVTIDGLEYEITVVNIVNSPNCAVTSYTRSGVSPDPGTITAFAAPAWTELISLSVNNFDQLESLDVSQNTKLETLDCAGNKLSALDVSGLNNLREISTSNNALLDVVGIESTSVATSSVASQTPADITMSYDPARGVYVSNEADLLSANRIFTFTADDPSGGAITWNANTGRFEARGDVVWPDSGIAGDFVTKYYTSTRNAASGRLTFMFEPATVDTLVASPSSLEHLGGKVDVTLKGTSLSDLTTRVKAVSSAGDERAVRLSGNLTEKGGNITVPENTSDQPVIWTFMVSLDGGTTWEQLTAAVTVNPAQVPTLADPALNTFSVSGGFTQAAGRAFFIVAEGHRQSVPGVVTGDTRYIPAYASANPTVNFTESGGVYSSQMTLADAGTYTLTVTYQLQEWQNSQWQDRENHTDIKTVTLIVNTSGGSGENGGDSIMARTGDNSNLILWLSLLAISASALVASIWLYIRRRRAHE